MQILKTSQERHLGRGATPPCIDPRPSISTSPGAVLAPQFRTSALYLAEFGYTRSPVILQRHR